MPLHIMAVLIIVKTERKNNERTMKEYKQTPDEELSSRQSNIRNTIGDLPLKCCYLIKITYIYIYIYIYIYNSAH